MLILDYGEIEIQELILRLDRPFLDLTPTGRAPLPENFDRDFRRAVSHAKYVRRRDEDNGADATNAGAVEYALALFCGMTGQIHPVQQPVGTDHHRVDIRWTGRESAVKHRRRTRDVEAILKWYRREHPGVVLEAKKVKVRWRGVSSRTIKVTTPIIRRNVRAESVSWKSAAPPVTAYQLTLPYVGERALPRLYRMLADQQFEATVDAVHDR